MKTINQNQLNHIVGKIGNNFRCFGSGSISAWNNPISIALENAPCQFAAGVDVKSVVLFLCKELNIKVQ